VSWWGGIYYCNWLSVKEGLPKAYDEDGNLLDKNGNKTTDITEVEGYRLPTEAEWEFTARGGNESKGYKYAGSNDLNEVAWYGNNSGGHTHEVGIKNQTNLTYMT
jgi:formylglycine-generating enzyme required for sulfatase activity